jgi:23S rRNA (pseudouridine1915-N3)-methyltransferase
MQILILSVGKRPEPTIQTLINDYEKRLSREYHMEWHYLNASKSSDKAQCQNEESDSLLKQVNAGDQVVLLDERGEQKDNQAFAGVFERLASAHGRLVFIVGGAYGVNDTLRQRANFVWSLSNLVFPHRLIRLILIEQLYRTVMVVKNHPYHHD